MDLKHLRTLFPHTETMVYMNHAAMAPLSRPVLAAIDRYLEQRHRTHIENFFAFMPVMEETKARLARLIGTTPEWVEFMPNTSYGLNVLAQGLDWQPGDRVAVPACEFPANVFPFLNLRRRGVQVDFIPAPGGTFTPDDVAAVLTPRTRVFSVSAVQFLSGFRADLAALGALCRERGILFCVDAIQALGALRIDVAACGIDVLACGGHKWLMATTGMGFLYVHPALIERIHPPAGWLHGPVDWEHLCDYELAFYPDARRFRIGTTNGPGIAALHAALGVYFEAGPAWCEARVLDNARRLADGLARLGLRRIGATPEPTSGIVTVAHPDAEALLEHLQRQNIYAAVRNRHLRFSPTYYNTRDEIDAVVDAVAAYGKTHVATGS
ncbi:MAG: aminotransferase class V-fold PLP-dependent enzyme [Bacteroidetes bacterium]|nr:MAG: aminotransferase class V-fold PLP-dependent enzyme [Bacteroidota bacterium]